jgi:hypothetical protein
MFVTENYFGTPELEKFLKATTLKNKSINASPIKSFVAP